MVAAILQSSEADLHLKSNASGWCTVTLNSHGQIFTLGADDFTVVAARLLQALEHDCGEAGEGQPEWILSLAEQHCSFYLQCLNSHTNLLIERADGQQIERVSLDFEEKKQWIATLGVAIRGSRF
jgi:hypothetical protein